MLSFAQFEREITGERIRDKVTASKRKGIWMGGAVPLGYRVENRALHVDEDEAEFVRSLSDLAKLVELFDAQGVSFILVTQTNDRTGCAEASSRRIATSLLRHRWLVSGFATASPRRPPKADIADICGYRVENRALHVVEEEAEFVPSFAAISKPAAWCASRRSSTPNTFARRFG